MGLLGWKLLVVPPPVVIECWQVATFDNWQVCGYRESKQRSAHGEQRTRLLLKMQKGDRHPVCVEQSP